jgi:hypothetical protein
VNEVGRSCGTHGRVEKSVQGFGEKKRPLGRPRCRWENGIRMALRETGWGGGGVNWIDLPQDRDLR